MYSKISNTPIVSENIGIYSRILLQNNSRRIELIMDSIKNYTCNTCAEYSMNNGGLVIVPIGNIQNRDFILLDDISAEIYEMIRENNTTTNILKHMIDVYDASEETINEELNKLFTILCDYGVVTLKQPDDNHNTSTNVSKSLTTMSNREIYSRMYTESISNNKPFKVFFELTYNCNLRCDHCYIQEKILQNSNKFLDIHILKNTIDDMVNMGMFDITLTGGECTLHPHFFEIVSYLNEKKILISILTNGHNIDEEFMKKLVKYNIFDVRVSFYGLKKNHDKLVKSAGAFEKSFNAMKLLKKYKQIGTAVLLVTKENFGEIDDFIDLFESNGLNYEMTPYIFPTTEGNKKPITYRLDEQNKKFIDKYVDDCMGSTCVAGVARFRVDPEGNVTPCELLRNVVLGNIYNESFKTIYNTKRTTWVEKFHTILVESECNQCSLKKYCNNCIGLSLMETGDLLKSVPYLCEVAKYRKEKANRIRGKYND